MRQLSLLALASAIALTAGLVLVFGGQTQSPTTEGPPRFVMAVIEETSTTSTTAVVLDAWIGVDHDELESIATELRVEEASTTTTTTMATTTTTVPKSPPAKKPSQPKPPPSTTTTTTTTPPAPTGGFNSGFEADFYSRVNSLRGGAGLAGLSRNGSLDSAARSWAKWMGTNATLKHSSNPSNLVPPWQAAGEIVGKGGSVSSVFDAFNASGGHRSIMVGDFTHIGIGVWVDGNGTIWTAQLFTKQ